MSNRESIYKGVLAFKLENTKYVVSFIRANDTLLDKCRAAGRGGVEQVCFNYAKDHHEQFGNRLIIELYDVFWGKVWDGIAPAK